jgi:DNA repair protein RadC
VTFHVAEHRADHGMVRTPSEAGEIARAVTGDDMTECVLVLYLDSAYRVTGYSEVARGSVNRAHLRVRDVFTRALLANAHTVVIAHNHPNGDPLPSANDRAMTLALRKAGRLLGLSVLDHLIVTPSRTFSIREDDGWPPLTQDVGDPCL